VVVHGGLYAVHHHVGIDGQADPHMVNRLACRHFAAAVQLDVIGFLVDQLGFHVPHAVITGIAPVFDVAHIDGDWRAAGTGRQGHGVSVVMAGDDDGMSELAGSPAMILSRVWCIRPDFIIKEIAGLSSTKRTAGRRGTPSPAASA
jgi:hypothetical protein